MSVLSVFLLVIFIIVAVLLILLVLIQNEDGDSLGGVFGGGSSTAFGSRSGNVLTKASTILGALFFILSLSLALLNRTPSDDKGIEEAGRQTVPVQTEQIGDFSKYQAPETQADTPDLQVDAPETQDNEAEPPLGGAEEDKTEN
ncbi:MAG: preprotein translocase subunit SecG [Spirochaetaceae bacterium]|jgi:preprotein translocase subunit SecG|nr:preprotein translocase subunit SecG [Spirochaetaceae bacterium]